jgi:hypothetical protein
LTEPPSTTARSGSIEPASSPAQLAKAGWLPATPWSGAANQLRQGDLLVGYYHQLRATGDEEGPAPASETSPKLPVLLDYQDRQVELSGAQLTVRVWHGWMTVVEQSCEIAQKAGEDSRMLVAPVVFRSKWNGAHWNQIRAGAVPSMFFLPPADESTKSRFQARGWPAHTDAAVVLESTTCVSRQLVPSAVFGLSGDMRAALQAQLVDFWSVRGWMRSKWAGTLEGKRISHVQGTYEQFLGPGRLHKIALEDDAGAEDEVTVGLVFAP